MKNIKKAVALLLSILVIIAVANTTFASTIQPRNTTNSGNGSNTENEAEADNETDDDDEEEENTVTNNSTNNTARNTLSNTSSNSLTNNVSSINTTNTAENIPHTGFDNTYLNFALILLLAVTLGMFSLVQYHKIVKKEE